MATGKLHQKIVDDLGMAIVSGNLPIGHALTLEQLQITYEASRTVVRECMRILEAAQMVVARPRLGIVIQSAQLWNPYDRNIIRWRLNSQHRHQQLQSITELRLGIEPTAAALAAIRATPQEREELRTHAVEMRAYGHEGMVERYRQADVAFHGVLLRATRNDMYAELCEPIAEAISAKPLERFYEQFPDLTAADLHFRVMEAVCAGDASDAERLMLGILRDVRTGLEAVDGVTTHDASGN